MILRALLVGVGLVCAFPALAEQDGGKGLQLGEYACTGSGGSVLAGLGFIVVSNHEYTDLDGGNAGTYAVSGSEVVFQGGHLDGQTGRELSPALSFRIGQMATCDPW